MSVGKSRIFQSIADVIDLIFNLFQNYLNQIRNKHKNYLYIACAPEVNIPAWKIKQTAILMVLL